MSGYTPRPWRVVEAQGMRGPTIDIADAQNRCVARCRAANESIPESEARANAVLIAAAPDLLAACHAALKMRAMIAQAQDTTLELADRMAASTEANGLSEQIRAAIRECKGAAMRFRKATPSQILTLNILSGVDILEAYKGFGIDVREVPAVKAQALIDKLREAELKRLQRNLERVAREAEERRERQRVNQVLATFFGVTTR